MRYQLSCSLNGRPLTVEIEIGLGEDTDYWRRRRLIAAVTLIAQEKYGPGWLTTIVDEPDQFWWVEGSFKEEGTTPLESWRDRPSML